jgi:hypothetical protein
VPSLHRAVAPLPAGAGAGAGAGCADWRGPALAADTVGAGTVFGVVSAAGVVGDETVLDDVGLGRDEVAGPLDAGPQPDSSTMAASSAVIDLMALFMVPAPVGWQRSLSGPAEVDNHRQIHKGRPLLKVLSKRRRGRHERVPGN